MPEIGATLRETRMRERIDIAEVESATKIRAKYLRALENEEWDLLPGPTFVKTFLRTYGDYLGLDSKMLVEEYKQRFERVSPAELMPFGGSLSGRRQQPRRVPSIPPFVVVGVVILGLLGVLFYLGNQDPETEAPNRAATPVPSAAPEEDEEKPAPKRKRAASTVVRLRLEPTGTVNVCLVDATGKVLIRSENLVAGRRTKTFRSRRFRVTFGNGLVRARVNGKAFDVPDRDDAIGYDITSKRRRTLPAAQRPTCAA